MNTNEHEERNKKSFWGNNWQWIVSMVMFVVFAGFMIFNTWPQKHPETRELLNGLKQQIPIIIGENTVEQKTTVKSVPVYDAWGRVVTANETSSTTKKSKLPESYVISKENMDKALTAVAYAARTEAQNEYRNNFSILLTILTIFGIAWPVIMTLVQQKLNEKELEMIKKSVTKDVEEKISLLENKTKDLVDNLAKDVYIKQGGIMAQITGQMKDLESKVYCELVTFMFLYNGNSFIVASKVLGILKKDFDELDFWSSADKKVQIVQTIKTFLEKNTIDPQIRIIIEELQEKAIRTEVKEQDK